MASPSAEVEALETPSMLDDKYRIDSLMAVGGMGAVYLGRHMQLHKTVAIKVLRRSLMGHSELVERFQREAIAASQIGHEGIIEVTDVGTSKEGDPFLVMEYLVGCDLAGCLKDSGALRTEVAVRLCCEILSAVAAAHDKDIIHRDLKPENIYVCSRARGELLKILDFGISRMPIEGDESMRLTSTGLVMGTPYYMSPEQALGDSSVGKAADIYSVAVILYELITGALPFKATNYNALLHQILVGEFDPPSSLADVSPELEAVMFKGMAFEQSARYPSARAFASALKRFAETTPSSILPVHTPHPDTFDDAAPVVATAPTSAAPSAVTRPLTETEVGGVSAGTMEPVVTPVPPAAQPKSSRRVPATAFAVLLLVVAVGGTLLATQQDGTGPESGVSAAGSVAEPDTSTQPSLVEVPVDDTITLTFAVAPSGASVYIDGLLVTGESAELPMSSTALLIEVKKDGFESQTRTVKASNDDTLAFALSAVEPAPVAAIETAKSQGSQSKKTKSKKQKAGKKTNKKAGRRFVGDSPYDAP